MTISTPAMAPVGATESTRRLEIEFLYLDLQTCTRCVGTDATLREALDLVRPALTAAGIGVHLTKRLIETEAEAERYQFISSPTIRINGQDIAGPLVESACDSCTNLCGCNGTVECRVWHYQGKDYTEAPTGLIVEALLRHAVAPAPIEPAAVAVPENLKQYFRSRSGPAGQTTDVAAAIALDCCPPAEQASCCEAGEKAACCGATPAGQSAGTCGCR